MTVCVSGYSEHPAAAAAVGEVVGDVLSRIDPHPDLAVLFSSGRFVAEIDQVVGAINVLLAPQVLIGSDVPRVFGGSDDRPATDGLLLWTAHLDDSDPITPVRFDNQEPALGWHTPNGEAMTDDGVTLALTEPGVSTDGIPGTVVGVGGSSGHGLVINKSRFSGGGVGVQLPAAHAAPIDFTLPLWEDVVRDEWDEDAGEFIEDHVIERHGEMFDPGDGAGLLLFAARSAVAPIGARFDFEIAFDRFHGAIAGAVAPVVWSPGPPGPPDQKHRAICGLVLR